MGDDEFTEKRWGRTHFRYLKSFSMGIWTPCVSPRAKQYLDWRERDLGLLKENHELCNQMSPYCNSSMAVDFLLYICSY